MYQELFAEHGRPLTEAEYYEHLAGHTDEEMFTWLGDADPALVAERARYVAAVADGSTVDAETRAAVTFAADAGPWRSSRRRSAHEIEAPVVAAAGLGDAIALIVLAGRCANGKPDPECYLTAARLLGVEPATLLVFEDTDVGVAAARAAGCACRRPNAHARRRAHGRSRRARRAHRPAAAGAPAVLVIAHRGASVDLPENTLPAFERAIEIGADYVEFDAQQLEVTHDASQARRFVSDACGRARPLPRAHRRDGRAEAPARDTVRRALALMRDDDVLVCFQRAALEEARALRPGIRTVQHVGFGVSIRGAAGAWAAGFQNERVTPRGLAARRLGLETTVYTVNDEARMRELAAARRHRRLH